MRIEDYAVVGDTQTMALIGRNGSVDWLCFPRFDSPACFSSLLGSREHGRWLLAPRGEIRRVRRSYRDATLILETEIDTDEGTVRIVDFMPIRGRNPDLVRIVEGVRGRVTMQLDLVIRYDYGAVIPWVRLDGGRLHAVAGPDALVLASPVVTEQRDGAVPEQYAAGGNAGAWRNPRRHHRLARDHRAGSTAIA